MPEQGKPWELPAPGPDDDVYTVAARLQAWTDAQKVAPAPEQRVKREPSVADFVAPPPAAPAKSGKKQQQKTEPLKIAPKGLKPEEVAPVLRVCERTVYNLVERGELQGFLIGKRGLRITPEAIDAYIRTHPK